MEAGVEMQLHLPRLQRILQPNHQLIRGRGRVPLHIVAAQILDERRRDARLRELPAAVASDARTGVRRRARQTSRLLRARPLGGRRGPPSAPRPRPSTPPAPYASPPPSRAPTSHPVPSLNAPTMPELSLLPG